MLQRVHLVRNVLWVAPKEVTIVNPTLEVLSALLSRCQLSVRSIDLRHNERAMITLESGAEYAPAGQTLLQYHADCVPNKKPKTYDQLWPPTGHNLNDFDYDLADFSLSTGSGTNHSSSLPDRWLLRESIHGEEELYVSGRVLIHSRGDGHGNFELLKSYTLDTPLNQALWADFLNEDAQDTRFSAVCSLDENNIEVFSEQGDHYPIGAPFQVRLFTLFWGMPI